VAVNQRLADNV